MSASSCVNCSAKRHRQTLNTSVPSTGAWCVACWAFGCSTKFLVQVVDTSGQKWITIEPGRALGATTTLESEKDMDLTNILQALAKDMAEHLRPMVADMVRQELANADGEKAMEGIAASIDLEKLAQHIDLATLAGELTEGQLNDIAGDIDLADLASEFDAEKIADRLDLDEAIRDFFQNNTFSIRP